MAIFNSRMINQWKNLKIWVNKAKFKVSVKLTVTNSNLTTKESIKQTA